MNENYAGACVAVTKISKAFMDYRAETFQRFSNVYKKTFDLMESYIKQYYSEAGIEALDEMFFERFYCSFLPLYSLKMSYYSIESISKEWVCFLEYVNNELGTTLTKSLGVTSFNRHQKNLQRIYYLIKEVRKFGEVPVLCWEPFIIDMRCYKNLKSKEKDIPKYMLFDQGYFVVQDKIGNNVIFSKDISTKFFYKVKIDEVIANEMKIGDIVNMSIKRKIFCTAWNIINVKAYFDNCAKEYLNLGGQNI